MRLGVREDRDDRVADGRRVVVEGAGVAEVVELTTGTRDPVAAVGRRRRHAHDVVDAHIEPRNASVERGVTEAEDPAVARDHAVALAGRTGRDAVDRPAQREVARSIRGSARRRS